VEAWACACGAREHELVLRGRFNRLGLHDFPFAVVRCARCGLARTVPSPDPGQYDDGYTTRTEQGHFTGATSDAWSGGIARAVARELTGTDRGDGLRLLDLGCHVGNLVVAAEETGFHAEGLDIDRVSVAGGQKLGRNVRVGTASDIEGEFDAVVLNHVLEHIHDLDGFLIDVRRALAPDGRVFVFVPYYLGLLPRVMGERWMGWSPSQHVWHFTPATLATTVERCGLRLLWTATVRVHEPPSTGAKGMAKRAVTRISELVGRGDQLEAVLGLPLLRG